MTITSEDLEKMIEMEFLPAQFMRLDSLENSYGERKNRKRVGRGIGSGVGKTCGRGTKGQKARTGVSTTRFEGGQMPLIWRFPKRGFNNIHRIRSEVVPLSSISDLIALGANDITPDVLAAAGLIKNKKTKFKILLNVELENVTFKEINFSNCPMSNSTKSLLEQVGCKVA